jgi:hypothetical protein
MKLLKEVKISPELEYHLGKNLSLSENVFRAGSTKFFEVFNEVRRLYRETAIALSEQDLFFIQEINIGEIGEYNHKRVYLDFPIPTRQTFQQIKEAEYKGRKVQLNKPKRGGSKKFYVYTKNPKTGNIIKVEFGAEGGGQNLAVKLRDPKARKAFADRHNCEKKTDRTKPGYWSCRLPRFSKALGLSGGGGTWW